MSLKEEICYVLTVEHFSGALTQIVGVFTDLEDAKKVMSSYDTLTRISVNIYRSTLYVQDKAKNVSKPKARVSKAKSNGSASEAGGSDQDNAPVRRNRPKSN